jgi:hypothetical protein
VKGSQRRIQHFLHNRLGNDSIASAPLILGQPDDNLDVLQFFAELLIIIRKLIETGHRISNRALSSKETKGQQQERIDIFRQFDNDMGSFLQVLNFQLQDASVHSKSNGGVFEANEVIELLLAGLNEYMKKIFNSSSKLRGYIKKISDSQVAAVAIASSVVNGTSLGTECNEFQSSIDI